MIQKLIEVTVVDGGAEEFIQRQSIWNEAMARLPGFVRATFGVVIGAPNRFLITVSFEGQWALDSFMENEHDELERATRISEWIDASQVTIVEVRDAI